MATGTGSLKELREKRKMELASTEYVNSNKILQGEETSIHSIFYIENVSFNTWQTEISKFVLFFESHLKILLRSECASD